MEFGELNTTDWASIARYLSGEMENGELELFEKRINYSDTNKHSIELAKTEWEYMEQLKKKDMFDENKAWGRLYSKMEADGLLDTKLQEKKFKITQLTKLAAVLIIGLLMTTVVYYLVSDPGNSKYMVADTYQNTEIKQVTLSDGSVVYLNANSKLYYPAQFEGNVRTVEFEGDGFFEIAKNPAKPFIIKAKTAEIKVLGTSFNVNTKRGEDDVEVLVASGKVQLSLIKNKNMKVNLEPGILGRLKNENLTFAHNTDVNYLSWKTRNFNFEGVPLSKAIEALERAYNIEIKCENVELGNIELNSPFKGKSIDTILTIICEMEQLKCEKEEDNFVLYRK